MKTVIAVVLLLVATAALADDDAEKLKVFRQMNPDDRPAVPRRVEFHTGYLDIHALGTEFRIMYLPFLAPLPGARLEDGSNIPSPFVLVPQHASSMPPMADKSVLECRARIQAHPEADCQQPVKSLSSQAPPATSVTPWSRVSKNIDALLLRARSFEVDSIFGVLHLAARSPSDRSRKTSRR
jgi:hypothetical protein